MLDSVSGVIASASAEFDNERTIHSRCRARSLMIKRHPSRPAPWTHWFIC